MTTIAVLSDIHGNLPALQAVLDDLAPHAPDLVINLGDILSGPLWPRETAALLMQHPWPTLAGNHERQLLDASSAGAADRWAADQVGDDVRSWLHGLPPLRWLTLPADGPGGAPEWSILACHGTPASDLAYLLETVTSDFGREGSRGIRAATLDEVLARLDHAVLAGPRAADLVLCGHTHTPRALQVPGGPLVLNPGSVGLPAYDDNHPHPHLVETGCPHARWALLTGRPAASDVSAGMGTPGSRRTAGVSWHVAWQATAYDWEAAARRAESNGRGDWADALRTGRVGRWERDVAGATGAVRR